MVDGVKGQNPAAPLSSDVDWCESNYTISSFIAEFYNTLSNILFIVLPPLLIYLSKQYAVFFNKGINIVWGLFVVVGLGSAYFHATLSIVGQLLDELAILWVLAVSLAMWSPRRLFPYIFNRDRRRIQIFFIGLATITSLMACIKPVANAFVLMFFGIPTFWLMVSELRRVRSSRVINLGIRSGVLWGFAIFCWINDRMFCEVWRKIGFPYLHSWWHILIFIASYNAVVLFAYFDAISEVPAYDPVLLYWPHDDMHIFGIPYISFRALSPRKRDAESSLGGK